MDIRIMLTLGELESFGGALLENPKTSLPEYVNLVDLTVILARDSYTFEASTSTAKSIYDRASESLVDLNELLFDGNPEAIYSLSTLYRALGDLQTALVNGHLKEA